MIEKTDIDLEKTVLEKMNCLLEYHWARTRNPNGFYFFYNPSSTWDKVRIDGQCLGRRFWKSLIQVVNAYSETIEGFIPNSPLAPIYEPFRGLESRSLEELAVKVDLAFQNVNIEDDIHKHRLFSTSTS